MTKIVYYVSGHGFGHAARSGQLMQRLVAMRSDLEIRLRTVAPPVLFSSLGSALPGSVAVSTRAWLKKHR